jgi:hypothetical protein
MKRLIYFIYFILLYSTSAGQDNRTQYPGFLKDAYFGVNVGFINYDFTGQQLKAGYTAQEISVPHFAVRVILYGRRLTRHLSAQISYMRPAGWVEYKNINGDGKTYTVGMNLAGLSLTGEYPISKKLSVYGEGGLGVVTRGGFFKDDVQVVDHANYATGLLGGGIKYKLNRNWELGIGGSWFPQKPSNLQPSTFNLSGGFNYTMRAHSPERLKRNYDPRYIFPRNILQAGYSTNSIGYGVNHLFSKTVPVFWGGKIELKNGLTLQYQRNIYHTKKAFSFDLGATLGYWNTRINNDKFFTAALFPLFRFTLVRSNTADFYLNYSLAGPAFISKNELEGKRTGNHFTFQDFMGAGFFTGKKRNLNIDFRIAHFSNGNIFPVNEGVKVPLLVSVGYCW